MDGESNNISKVWRCKYCDQTFTYGNKDVKWDYRGTIDTKIVFCSKCNKANIIRYWDTKINNPNTDNRYFF